MEIKPEIYADIVRNAQSAGAQILWIKFKIDTMQLSLELLMEPDTLRVKEYFYSSIYLGELDTMSFMQHVRNIVAGIAKHHATLDTIDNERFRREVLY